MKYRNPILRGFHPDPSICKAGNSYYLVNSSFEFLPGIPVYKSEDLINWQLVSHVIDQNRLQYYTYSNLKNSFGIFAPTIRFNKGIFYIACAAVPDGLFIVETKDPIKGWSQPHWIKTSFGIDPSLTFIKDKCYLQMTKEGKIIQFPINPHSGEITGKQEVISFGTGGRDPEGPHVYHQFGKYWLLLAEGGTREGHMATMQVANNIHGPYRKLENNPILSNRNYKGILQCVGHADIVETGKNNFELVALATRQPLHVHRTLLGRETILLPVEWNDQGIKVNQPNRLGNATLLLDDPIKNEYQNFENEKLCSNNFISLAGFTQFGYKNDSLALLANMSPLLLPKTGQSAPSFLGFSQAEFSGTFSFVIRPKELSHLKCGLAIYKDDHHIFETLYDCDKRQFLVNKQDSDLKNIFHKDGGLNDNISQLEFILHMSEDKYLMVVKNEKRVILQESMLSRHFTNEVSDSPFTGVVIGFRAIGKVTAKFHFIKLRYEIV